jgi:glycosyltransferase involved in cell wall biosynthesis
VTPRRILIAHERFPPDIGGGGEQVVLEVASGLAAAGHSVRVICAGDAALTQHEGQPTERSGGGRYAFNLQLRRLMRGARDADIIQAFNYHAALPAWAAARLTGTPIVTCMLGLFGPAWRGMKGQVMGRAFEAFERLIVSRRYDRTVFLSPSSLEMGVAMGAPRATSCVLPPGIDARHIRTVLKPGPLVVFAGLFDVRKGVELVLEAARAFPDTRFRLLGWGPRSAEIEATAPPNAEVISGHAREAYSQALGEGTIFLFPSYAETFGLVVAEAMASGCAVLSSVDTIDYAGVRFAPGDGAAMRAALGELLRDPARVAAMGADNRERAAVFTWKRHLAGLEALHDEVLAEAGRRG